MLGAFERDLKDGLFTARIQMPIQRLKTIGSLSSEMNNDSSSNYATGLWHQRMAHVQNETMTKMFKQDHYGMIKPIN